MSINTKTTRRMAAVLAPAACVAVVAFVLLSPNPQRSAFAAAIERIRSASTIVAHFDAYLNHSEIPMQSGTMSMSDQYGMRFDASANAAALPGIPNVMAMTMTHQPGGPVVLVQPALKLAMRMHTPDGTMAGWSGAMDQSSPDQFLEAFRKLTGEADREIGLSVLDGREVEGFEVSARKLGLEFVGSAARKEVVDAEADQSRALLWVDAATHLPVRMEVDVVVEAAFPLGNTHVRAVYSDFEFDLPLEASLFEAEIPEDARVFDIDVPKPSEETLLSALGLFVEKTGRYPMTLDPSRISAELMILLARETESEFDAADPMSILNGDMMEAVMRVAMGCGFVQQLARDGAEPEYFGDIVTPEDQDDVLFRWLLPGGEARVVYGDLSVETLP